MPPLAHKGYGAPHLPPRNNSQRREQARNSWPVPRAPERKLLLMRLGLKLLADSRRLAQPVWVPQKLRLKRVLAHV